MAASNLLEKLDPALLRPGPLRSPGLRLAARRQGPRADPARPHAPTSRCARTSTSTSWPSRRAASPAPTWPTSATRRRSSARAARATPSRARTSTTRSSASSPACSPRPRSTSTSAASSPSTRPATRCAASCSTGVDRVHKISIVPRGSALGYVVNLPDEDSYLKTREELVDQMTVLLGGRVAEQIVFGAVTTGAANDLQRVEEITHAMIHQYAMGSGDAPQAALKDAGALGPHAPHPRRGAARAGLRGAPRRVGPHHRPPRAAGPHRRRAARERDARARADRPHHGGRAAPRAPQARCRDLRIAAAEKQAPDAAD